MRSLNQKTHLSDTYAVSQPSRPEQSTSMTDGPIYSWKEDGKRTPMLPQLDEENASWPKNEFHIWQRPLCTPIQPSFVWSSGLLIHLLFWAVMIILLFVSCSTTNRQGPDLNRTNAFICSRDGPSAIASSNMKMTNLTGLNEAPLNSLIRKMKMPGGIWPIVGAVLYEPSTTSTQAIIFEGYRCSQALKP